ncbi:MAG: DUF1572 domain-containing protein [Bacteroidia bacterium]
MSITSHIAKHLREVYFGGNWTAVNFRDTVSDITWEQATAKVQDFNTILTLVYHMHYYVHEITKVLEGGPLTSKDEYSFSHPPIQSEEEWQALLNHYWKEAEHFIGLIEKLPDSILAEDFTDAKYGIYYRNLSGIVEHTHYHLGQIRLLKKMV